MDQLDDSLERVRVSLNACFERLAATELLEAYFILAYCSTSSKGSRRDLKEGSKRAFLKVLAFGEGAIF